MQNVGKKFEDAIKRSVPDYCLLIRIPDPPQSFTKRSDTRFSVKNPCDYICYDSKNRLLYCLELKTTSSKSMSFDNIKSDEEQNHMIHRHQIEGLMKFADFDNVVAGFLFNFRHFEGTDKSFETTYFQDVDSFNKMCDNVDKHSFNEIDLCMSGNIKKIIGQKKRTRYTWDLDSFFDSYKGI